MDDVKTAVIAAGGLGTRFLPQTKAMPKEMLPIVDRPVIQIIIEDIVAAGVEEIIIVTGPQKKAVEDHFDYAVELEHELIESGKQDKADEIRRIADLANFIYVRQKGPYGTARPIASAANIIKNAPFFYFFADDFFVGEIPAAKQMLEAYKATGGKSVLALREVDQSDTDKYGVIEPKEQMNERLYTVNSIIEKPGPDNAPSNLASIHGYLFTPEVLHHLNPNELSTRGEFEIQPAINTLAQEDKVAGAVIDGIYHDAGNVEKYLEAVVDVALRNPTVAPEFRQYLKDRLANNE